MQPQTLSWIYNRLIIVHLALQCFPFWVFGNRGPVCVDRYVSIGALEVQMGLITRSFFEDTNKCREQSRIQFSISREVWHPFTKLEHININTNLLLGHSPTTCLGA